MASRVLGASKVSNLVVLMLNIHLLELVWNVLVGDELAFTRIKALYVVIICIMANSICALIMSLSSLGMANAFLMSLTSCVAATGLTCIDLLSAILAVTSRFSFTIVFPVASSARSGTASSLISLEACCANLSYSA